MNVPAVEEELEVPSNDIKSDEGNAYIGRLSHYVLEVEAAGKAALCEALHRSAIPYHVPDKGQHLLIKKTDSKAMFALLRQEEFDRKVKVKKQVIGMATVEIQRLYIFFGAVFISALITILLALYLFGEL